MDTLLLQHTCTEDPSLAHSLGLRDLGADSDVPLDDDEVEENSTTHLPRSSLPDISVLSAHPGNIEASHFLSSSDSYPREARTAKKHVALVPDESNVKTKRMRNLRLGLPLTLDTHGTVATVLACADTGAYVNIISHELAQSLGYTNYETALARKQFKLADGKIIEAIGQITSTCAFGVETEVSMTMSCIFYVLSQIVTPIIMGMQFLHTTETMTKHRNRLVRLPRPARQALSVCSLDRPRQFLSCVLEFHQVMATPDTGSEIDLMSPQLAADMGSTVHAGEQVIQIADGSIDLTSGYVIVTLTLIDP